MSSLEKLPWFEEDRPRTFSDLTHGKKVNTILERLSQSDECLPNIFLYGSSGNGKYTRFLITLKQMFLNKANPYQMKMRTVNEETGEFCQPDVKASYRMMMVLTSSCHCVVDLAQPTVKKGLLPFLNMFCRTKNVALNTYKYVIFRHADKIDTDLQAALRKIIETYGKNVCFLVTARSLTGWNPILVSRFLPLRLQAPTRKEASTILKYVGRRHRVKMDRNDRRQMIERSRVGSSGTIHLGEMLMILEIGKDYIPDRKNVVNLLITTMGSREQMRKLIELVYIHHTDDYVDILTGDLVHQLLPTLQEDTTKRKCIELSAKWDHTLRKDSTPYPLLVGEAYYFALAELIEHTFVS